jgi:uncharacterized membrane protein YdbT with pleckstrin-like domain
MPRYNSAGGESLTDLTIRPTAKFLIAKTALAVILLAAFEAAWYRWWQNVPYFYAVGLLFLLWPAREWLRRAGTRAVISGGRLRAESGIAGRSTRTVELARVQDVRVDQSLGQRLFGVGDVSLETAGETSRLTLRDVDAPQQVADLVMNAAQRGAGA